MRLSIVVLAFASWLGGCAPGVDEAGPAADPVMQTLPPGASGKLGADQVDELSPVPAFRALGDGWRMQAEGTEGMRLSARLQRNGFGVRNATLVYDRLRAGMSPRTHVLAGTLYGGDAGDLPVTVTLVRERCDNAEGEHAWRAEVVVEGGERLVGCADVAT